MAHPWLGICYVSPAHFMVFDVENLSDQVYSSENDSIGGVTAPPVDGTNSVDGPGSHECYVQLGWRSPPKYVR